MGAYFLKINRLSAASLRSLHRRLIISSRHHLHVPGRQSIVQGDTTNAQLAPEETTSSTTKPSTQWDLHLSVTSKHGNRTLPTSSHKWKVLRKEILLRDNRTCSSCGYLSPYPNGRYMVVDHVDGDRSNNDLSNLRINCPPCDAIRHYGFASVQNWITVSKSTMGQVEIVHKTREIFEKTGVIPDPISIDPSVKHVSISAVELANMLLRTPRKDLPEGLQRLRGFFTMQGGGLFRKTMLTENPDTYVCFFHFK
jgi:5-methylcytosine-specific restriction endonuclease McrA